MQENDLLRYLRVLRKDEMRRLKTYLSQQQPRLAALLNAFLENGPDFRPCDIEEQQLHEAIFPKKAFELQRLRNYNTKLKTAIEDFLALEALQRQPELKKTLLVDSLKNRSHPQVFDNNYKQLQKLLNKSKPALDPLFLKFNQHLLLLGSLNTLKNKAGLKALQEARWTLDQHYLLWHLFFELESYYRSFYLQEEYRSPQLHLDAPYWSRHLEEGPPTLALLYQLYQLYQRKGDYAECLQAFQKLKASHSSISPVDARELFIILTNYIAYQYSKQIAQYAYLLLQLYQWAAQEGLLHENGYISHTLFINVVVLAGVCNDIKYAEQFIKNNSPYLLEATKTLTLQYCEALLHFHKGNYSKATDLLDVMHPPNHIDFSLRRQSLWLRVVFSQYLAQATDANTVEDRCKTYRQFFSRNSYKINEELKLRYMQLEYFVRQMTRYYNDPNSNIERAQIQRELQAKKCIAWQWVQQKSQKLP